MNYSMMELVWLLLIYSFLGWVVETIVGTVKKKKFVNRGFSTGPFCLVYGIAAVFMAVHDGRTDGRASLSADRLWSACNDHRVDGRKNPGALKSAQMVGLFEQEMEF